MNNLMTPISNLSIATNHSDEHNSTQPGHSVSFNRTGVSMIPFSPTARTERRPLEIFGSDLVIDISSDETVIVHSSGSEGDWSGNISPPAAPRNSIVAATSGHARLLQGFEIDVLPSTEDDSPMGVRLNPLATPIILASANVEEIAQNTLKQLNKITTILGTLETIYNLMRGQGVINSSNDLSKAVERFITEAKETTAKLEALKNKIKDNDVPGIIEEYTALLKEIEDTKAAGGALIESLKKVGKDAEEAIQQTASCFKDIFSCFFSSNRA